MITRTLTIFLFLIYSFNSYSQGKKSERLFNKALESFRAGDIENTITLATKTLEIDDSYIDAKLLLADVYKDLDSISLEIQYLEFALADSSSVNYKIHLRLANTCLAIGEYEKAKMYFQKCFDSPAKSITSKKPLQNKIGHCNNCISIKNNPVSEDVKRLGDEINTSKNEYWPTLPVEGNKLVFTRLVDGQRFMQEDFYQSEFKNDGWQTALPLSGLNTLDNEGAQSISADGRLLFFSACNRADGLGRCDIYLSIMAGGKWSEPKNVGAPVNSKAWESQPSISANAEYLYFVSNRDGGKGQKDIWRCKIIGFNDNGFPEWGKPENLGSNINTKGNEQAPFIHFNGNDLLFTSDSLPGLGKSDIFYSKKQPDGQFSKPVNFGYPINSHYEEQSLVVDASGQTLYFASAREKNNGMDIYSSQLLENHKLLPVTYLKAKILDSETQLPVMAQVELSDLDKNAKVDIQIQPDEKGEFILCLPVGKNYAFNVSSDGYLFYSEGFNLKEIREVIEPIEKEIHLIPIKTGESIVLNNVYFNHDSFDLLPESLIEILKLADFLLDNPSVSVEIGGHTDNIGSENYNLELSGKRAESVVNQLIESGVETKRLKFRGYGFSIPVADNETEKGRQKNRRTEAKILEM